MRQLILCCKTKKWRRKRITIVRLRRAIAPLSSNSIHTLPCSGEHTSFRVTENISSYSKDTLLLADADKIRRLFYRLIVVLPNLEHRMKYLSADWLVRCDIGIYQPICKRTTIATGRKNLPVSHSLFNRNRCLLIQQQYIP